MKKGKKKMGNKEGKKKKEKKKEKKRNMEKRKMRALFLHHFVMPAVRARSVQLGGQGRIYHCPHYQSSYHHRRGQTT